MMATPIRSGEIFFRATSEIDDPHSSSLPKRIAETERPELGAPVQLPKISAVVDQPKAAEKPGLIFRIISAVTNAFKQLIEWIATHLCCLRKTQPAANKPVDLKKMAQADQDEEKQPVAPLQQIAEVEAEFLPLGDYQPLGHFVGTLSLNSCANEFLIKLWGAVANEENLSTPGYARYLIDTTLRDGAKESSGLALLGLERIEKNLRQITDYRPFVQAISAEAKKGMAAGTLDIGKNKHVILVDLRSSTFPRYYHFNPQENNGPAALHILGTELDLVIHLNKVAPFNHPADLRIYKVND